MTTIQKHRLGMIATLSLLLCACKSTSAVVEAAPPSPAAVPFPEFTFPDFPELFVTVHTEDIEALKQTIVPDNWLAKVSDFNKKYQTLQTDYTAKKATNEKLPDVTFPQTPELLITVHKDEFVAQQQSVVSDDWLYKLADFCDQYQSLQNVYAKAKAANR